MIDAYDARAVRAAEAPLLAAGVDLMGRAAHGLAGAVVRVLRERRGRAAGARVLALVGPGNNGGDTLHAAAVLARRGVAVTALLVGAQTHDAGLAAARASGVRVRPAAGSDVGALVLGQDVVLDGLLGIGASGGLREAPAGVVREVSAVLDRAGHGRAVVVAVDVPSGIGVDDGSVPGVVLRADRTVTFGAVKPGLLLPPAAALAGRVELVEIGLDLTQERPAVRRLELRDVLTEGLLAPPDGAAHKYTRGVLGVVAGTDQFPGAAVLTVSGAVRAGVGMVRYLGPPQVTAAVLAQRPEAVPAPGRVQAWTVGPGIASAPAVTDEAVHAQQRRARRALAQVLAERDAAAVPAVVDAGALALLPERCPPWVVLTPHAGELAELLRGCGESVERKEVEAEPLRWARRAHDLTGATVLLKGPVTVVVGHGVALAQADGPAWLATAGAGDVLAGVLGALLAARSVAATKDPGLPARIAAAAALVHGVAAHRANPGGPVAALDVADAVPGTVAILLGSAA